MLKIQVVLLLVCFTEAVDALYKQWIPDTNYENKTNWDRGDVPCGNDIVAFSAQTRVSVFVETTHAVKEMKLPIDGEFILNSGAGFYVLGEKDPGCGAGATTQFKDSESHQWFDPSLWQAAATLNDLEQGKFLFSVDEESIPCHFDDVVFKALSSFRVDTSGGQSSIPVKSVSVLGKTFGSASEFSEYLSSRSGQLQFHGASPVTVGEPGCGDPSGCSCGNSVYHDQICGIVKCASPSCKNPLLPVGHCCEVCGTIVTINFAEGFSLHDYRERIRHLFLTLPQYTSVQLGMSKVLKPQQLMRVIPFGTKPVIQVVILDEDGGAHSEDLAWDIVNDVSSHGANLGITGAELQSSGHPSENITGTVVGAVIGILLVIILVTMIVLIRKGVVQMPALNRFRRNTGVSDLGGALDHGFDNPMFDRPNMMPEIPDLYGSEPADVIHMTQTSVHYVNPVYDDSETDFYA
ncbi:protein amnionless [Pholidichthys leucotaenia]